MTKREACLMAETASHSESDWVFVLQKRLDIFTVSTRRRLPMYGNEYKIITKFHNGHEV